MKTNKKRKLARSTKHTGVKYPTYMIQFYYRKGICAAKEVSNVKKGREIKDFEPENMRMFARGMADSNLLDTFDKYRMKDFCEEFVNIINTREKESLKRMKKLWKKTTK